MKLIGFTPYPHQRAVIDTVTADRGTGRITCVLSSRQKGKSLMIANLLLYYAINCPKTKNFCVSPTLKQARAIYTVIVDAITPAGIIENSNATDLSLKISNGSYINFKSAEQGAALRGYTADFLCIDEACFISDDAFYTILPWVDARKAPLLMVSTPFIREGFFYRYYCYGREKSHSTVTIDWSDPEYRDSIERILPPERLEEYRQVLPANQFKSEYLGQWLDSDGQVFTGFRGLTGDTAPAPGARYWVGIDWASGVESDDTVIAVIDDRGREVFLDYFNNLSTTEQIDRLMRTIIPIEDNIVSIRPELNGVGTPMTDLLTARLRTRTQSRLSGHMTSNQSKAAMVSLLQVAFENGEITLKDDDRQMRELGAYAAEYNPRTKNVYYNAPPGLHDDIPMALMLAWAAYKDSAATGQYSLGGAKFRSRPLWKG